MDIFVPIGPLPSYSGSIKMEVFCSFVDMVLSRCLVMVPPVVHTTTTDILFYLDGLVAEAVDEFRLSFLAHPEELLGLQLVVFVSLSNGSNNGRGSSRHIRPTSSCSPCNRSLE